MARGEAVLDRSTGASRRGVSLTGLLRNYLLRHLQTLFYTLGQLSLRPFSTLMTSAVIGIALAMPAALHLVLLNGQQVLQGWESATQISLFLKVDTSDSAAQRLADELQLDSAVFRVDYISRDSALEEFSRSSGFGDALDALESNPLPAVLLIQPTAEHENPARMAELIKRLSAKPEVDLAQLDMEWVERLFALLSIVERGVWVVSALLALGVVLVVGNTIRLAIQSRRDEIVITKLIGATDAFIRRPFLYNGLWYGLFGGAVALLLVELSLWLLDGPVRDLALLYQSSYRLLGLEPGMVLLLLVAGSLLGLGGSWLAVGRHLREIEPS